MTKKFLAIALSASLALTSISATPVQAGDRKDVAKILAGLAALAIIGTAVSSNNNNDRNVNQKATRRAAPKAQVQTQRRQRQVKSAPQQCLRNQWTHRGNRQVYSARCMNRNADARLPQNCLREADVRQGPRSFYTRNCLRQHGWRA